MLKKRCPNCNKKIERKFEFCPWCGGPARRISKEDYGLLGKKDEEFLFNDNHFLSFEKIIEKIFSDMNNLFSGTLNNTKEERLPIGNIQIKFSSVPQKDKEFQQKENIISKNNKKIKKELLEKQLPIVNAKANLKRLPEGIVYEIFVPGVKSKDDILINEIEEGIEIKAYSKDKCYVKTIPLKVESYSFFVKDNRIFFQIKN